MLFKNNEPDLGAWTVSQLNVYLRELFDIDYRLQDIRVKGEVSNFTRARSGHVYFTLKDDQAQIRCVMWRSSAEKLFAWPEEGDAAIARGHVTVYEAGGVYQLYTESLSLVGRGDLALEFERLKNALAAEGLFSEEHKKAIPIYPQKLGIATSADAAALRDVINVTRRRWPTVSILIAPTLVQGPQAPSNIVAALQFLDGRDDIDTIILTRGGGSIEDLAAFNDETVVRSIFNMRHPIIVGVGHESDFTLADFVADMRAPTPSAAAELAVPDQDEVRVQVEYRINRLMRLGSALVADHQRSLAVLERNLMQLSPVQKVYNAQQQVDWLSIRLDSTITTVLDSHRSHLTLLKTALDSVGPFETMRRGYAIVERANQQIVKSVQDVDSGEMIEIRVIDGVFSAEVGKGNSDE